jgi:sigma-E factor negative regulatory protein RseA
MKDRISALMDGELADGELDGPMSALRQDGEALEAWRRYHLISDALRDTPGTLSSGFSARFAERLALEPTVLSPASIPARAKKSRTWIPLSAAASIAAIAVVGSMAPQFFEAQVPTVAQRAPERPVPSVMTVPMPGAVNDYLLAHQNYSPRSTLQGVAPYVRTVSDSARPR